ncbi:MAG: COX15/CtaA family protein [Janthinobacterium lividum]
MGRLLKILRSGRGSFSFAAVALGWMVLVVLEGAIVRATGSGAGCGSHWPLCNGDFVPHHPRLATVIEFTHRSMTGICTMLVAGVIGWTFLIQPKGSRVRKAAVWSGLLLITEALLGAVLVLGGYVEHNASNARVLVQCVHFTNTMLLLGALSLAWWWQRSRQPFQLQHPAACRTALLALAFTILTGATGSVAALADTLFPAANLQSAWLADFSSSSPLLIRMRWMHPAASAGTFVLIGTLAFLVDEGRRKLLLSLLGFQFMLGVADVLALAPVTLQVLHLLGADLLWIALVCTAADVLLATRKPIAVSSTNDLVAPSNLAAKAV